MNDLNEIQSILKTEFAAFETSDSGILNFTQTVMQYLPEYNPSTCKIVFYNSKYAFQNGLLYAEI